jgi:arginyl-tRNA synthetase
MVEYSQPNTHKELHVGHMRNLCLGNAVVRQLRYIGNQVFAVTYPGDVGTHVAKCLWYLKKFVKEKAPESRKGAWLGELYSKGHLLLEDQRGSDKEEANRAELTAILKQLEAQKGEYYQLWQETRPWSIDLMQEVYDWAGVKFDHWFWESQMDSPSLEMARQLHQQGKLISSEGAIGMDLSEEKLGFCMLIKTDGTGLYATKDVMLAQKKFADYHLDYSLYIVDKRQTLHFQQVFKVLEKIGFAHAKDCHHLAYDFVELPDGAMSSRKGNIVPIMSLMDQMKSTIIAGHLEKYRGQWPDAEIEETAKMVANGAIKYGMLKMDTMRKIVFDMKEWLKLEGETGPYLQYVHARIMGLLDKHPLQNGTIQWQLAASKHEEMLMSHLVRFNQSAAEAAIQYRPSLLCTYLYDLAKLFNSFYAECPIGKASEKELQQMRLSLSKATGLVMAKGLELLGIGAPKRM